MMMSCVSGCVVLALSSGFVAAERPPFAPGSGHSTLELDAQEVPAALQYSGFIEESKITHQEAQNFKAAVVETDTAAAAAVDAATKHAENVKELGAKLKQMRKGVLDLRDASRAAHDLHAEEIDTELEAGKAAGLGGGGAPSSSSEASRDTSQDSQSTDSSQQQEEQQQAAQVDDNSDADQNSLVEMAGEAVTVEAELPNHPDKDLASSNLLEMGEAATVKGELTDSPDPSKPGSDTKPTKDFGKDLASSNLLEMGEAATAKGELTDNKDPKKDPKPTKDFGKDLASSNLLEMGEAATVKGELTDSPDPSKPGSDTKPTKDFGKES